MRSGHRHPGVQLHADTHAELPMSFQSNAVKQLVERSICDPNGNIIACLRDGLLKTDFKAKAKAKAKDEPDVTSNECPMADHHIARGTEQTGAPAKTRQHPLSVFRQARGLART